MIFIKIIIDTREQLPLKFTGHETVRRKLDEGDYNIHELEDKLVIERKSLADFYASITSDHQRFKREILRAQEKRKKFYIFLEGSLEDFYYLNWSKRPLKITPDTLRKIVMTMKERYELIIIECESRKLMSRQIVTTIENEKKLWSV